jgi:hypothetical protein
MNLAKSGEIEDSKQDDLNTVNDRKQNWSDRNLRVRRSDTRGLCKGHIDGLCHLVKGWTQYGFFISGPGRVTTFENWVEKRWILEDSQWTKVWDGRDYPELCDMNAVTAQMSTADEDGQGLVNSDLRPEGAGTVQYCDTVVNSAPVTSAFTENANSRDGLEGTTPPSTNTAS